MLPTHDRIYANRTRGARARQGAAAVADGTKLRIAED